MKHAIDVLTQRLASLKKDRYGVWVGHWKHREAWLARLDEQIKDLEDALKVLTAPGKTK